MRCIRMQDNGKHTLLEAHDDVVVQYWRQTPQSNTSLTYGVHSRRSLSDPDRPIGLGAEVGNIARSTMMRDELYSTI